MHTGILYWLCIQIIAWRAHADLFPQYLPSIRSTVKQIAQSTATLNLEMTPLQALCTEKPLEYNPLMIEIEMSEVSSDDWGSLYFTPACPRSLYYVNQTVSMNFLRPGANYSIRVRYFEIIEGSSTDWVYSYFSTKLAPTDPPNTPTIKFAKACTSSIVPVNLTIGIPWNIAAEKFGEIILRAQLASSDGTITFSTRYCSAQTALAYGCFLQNLNVQFPVARNITVRFRAENYLGISEWSNTLSCTVPAYTSPTPPSQSTTIITKNTTKMKDTSCYITTTGITCDPTTFLDKYYSSTSSQSNWNITWRLSFMNSSILSDWFYTSTAVGQLRLNFFPQQFVQSMKIYVWVQALYYPSLVNNTIFVDSIRSFPLKTIVSGPSTSLSDPFQVNINTIAFSSVVLRFWAIDIAYRNYRYKIQYRRMNTTSWYTGYIGNYPTEVELNGLSPGTKYNVQVLNLDTSRVLWRLNTTTLMPPPMPPLTSKYLRDRAVTASKSSAMRLGFKSSDAFLLEFTSYYWGYFNYYQGHVFFSFYFTFPANFMPGIFSELPIEIYIKLEDSLKWEIVNDTSNFAYLLPNAQYKFRIIHEDGTFSQFSRVFCHCDMTQILEIDSSNIYLTPNISEYPTIPPKYPVTAVEYLEYVWDTNLTNLNETFWNDSGILDNYPETNSSGRGINYFNDGSWFTIVDPKVPNNIPIYYIYRIYDSYSNPTNWSEPGIVNKTRTYTAPPPPREIPANPFLSAYFSVRVLNYTGIPGNITALLQFQIPSSLLVQYPTTYRIETIPSNSSLTWEDSFQPGTTIVNDTLFTAYNLYIPLLLQPYSAKDTFQNLRIILTHNNWTSTTNFHIDIPTKLAFPIVSMESCTNTKISLTISTDINVSYIAAITVYETSGESWNYTFYEGPDTTFYFPSKYQYLLSTSPIYITCLSPLESATAIFFFPHVCFYSCPPLKIGLVNDSVINCTKGIWEYTGNLVINNNFEATKLAVFGNVEIQDTITYMPTPNLLVTGNLTIKDSNITFFGMQSILSILGRTEIDNSTLTLQLSDDDMALIYRNSSNYFNLLSTGNMAGNFSGISILSNNSCAMISFTTKQTTNLLQILDVRVTPICGLPEEEITVTWYYYLVGFASFFVLVMLAVVLLVTHKRKHALTKLLRKTNNSRKSEF